MDSLATLSLSDYLERLASSDAVPGGGAVAAITGAQAAALLSMVVGITTKETSPASGDVTRLLSELASARNRLLQLATKDGEAFSTVMSTYRLPNVTESDKATRKEALQKALRGATEAPLAVMQAVVDLLPKIEIVIGMTKTSVKSDASIAIEMWATALSTARYNVDINLRYLKDETYKHEAAARAAALAAHLARRDALLKAIAQLP